MLEREPCAGHGPFADQRHHELVVGASPGTADPVGSARASRAVTVTRRTATTTVRAFTLRSITGGVDVAALRARTEPAEVVRNAKALAGLGVETLVISANTSDPGEARSAMEMMAREVLPANR